jgi:hypothetical protein
MDEMKKQALEKLMMVLDDILGSDVKGRMHKDEEEKRVASGGASVLALPEAESEEVSEEEEESEEKSPKDSAPFKPKGIGVEVEEVKVAAMPKPGLMKKMRGMKA